ncbi:MAG TPA: FecR family protein, partial [Steroidobacteraceae bacterium]
MKNSQRSFGVIVGAWLALCLFGTSAAFADEGDPSTRVARLAYIEGAVSFQPGGTDDWVSPPINRPLTTGDQLWSDRGSRAELQLDGSSLRLSANTAVSLLNLSDTVTQIQLSSGTLLLRVRRLDDNETYEVDTPNLAFVVLRPGLYRLTVDGSGNSTAILVRRGEGEVTGGGTSYPIGDGEYDIFSGTDELSENAQPYNANQDSFDAWSAARDARWDHSVSAQYVSRDVVGYEDLDEQGTWTPDPQYGHVWYPRAVEPGWAPYRDGHWAYVAPWGYTWVDDSAWGFAPFHYGRWV